MNTYELAKITQPTCGSLFKSVMTDWLGMACHYLFIFSQQMKVFRQNFSQTRNSLPIIAKSGFLAKGECLAWALQLREDYKDICYWLPQLFFADFLFYTIDVDHFWSAIHIGMAWIRNYIHIRLWGIINHPCPNSGLVTSLAPGRSGCDSKNVIFSLVLLIGIFKFVYARL